MEYYQGQPVQQMLEAARKLHSNRSAVHAVCTATMITSESSWNPPESIRIQLVCVSVTCKPANCTSALVVWTNQLIKQSFDNTPTRTDYSNRQTHASAARPELVLRDGLGEAIGNHAISGTVRKLNLPAQHALTRKVVQHINVLGPA